MRHTGNFSKITFKKAILSSLRENISFFETSPDTKRIQSMAKLACIHDDIISHPMGYDSHVDHDTEMQIMKNLRDLHITCLFVTHNDKLVRFADQIVYWGQSNAPLARSCG